ncbi:hypothetical protein Srufu_047150 [Streptomyces libani subsp. rufus]|nr:hypothetical protein Srufu_047150 [Streptomyces libani subsp. rufus]
MGVWRSAHEPNGPGLVRLPLARSVGRNTPENLPKGPVRGTFGTWFAEREKSRNGAGQRPADGRGGPGAARNMRSPATARWGKGAPWRGGLTEGKRARRSGPQEPL